MDWRLSPADPISDYPWVNYSTPDAVPVSYVDRLATYSLAMEDTLQTAITLSLFSDARPGAGDPVPSGVSDLRGWVGDEFQQPASGQLERFGSLLWLVMYGKTSDQVLDLAKFYASESLAWLVRDGIASKVVVDAVWVQAGEDDRLAIRPQIFKADRPKPIYDVLWGTTIRRGASA